MSTLKKEKKAETVQEDAEQLDEISAHLAWKVGKKRLRQGQNLQSTLSTPNLSPHLRRPLKQAADKAFHRSKKAYEYAFRKNVARGEELAKLEEMAFDPEEVQKRSQAAKKMLDAASKVKKGVTMKEQFAPIGDVITLIANQQPGEATGILNDLLGARVSESLAARKQEVAQSLFVPSADNLAEETEQLEEEKKKEKKAETVAQFLKRGGKITQARPHKAHGAPGPQKIKVPYRMGSKAIQEAEQLDEMQTRKHFQAAADAIKANPNLHERQILANHHAALFAAQNPRFDHARFHAAAGTTYQK